MELLSVNLGRAKAVTYTDNPQGVTGIDKRPVDGPVRVSAPGPKGVGGSGLAGDAVCKLPAASRRRRPGRVRDGPRGPGRVGARAGPDTGTRRVRREPHHPGPGRLR